MYEIILILSLIVTGSICYDSEFDISLSAEMQSADRYLESSNAKQYEDNRPERRIPNEMHFTGENNRNNARQEPSITVIALTTNKGVLRPRTDNYEHRLRTNAPPLARVPLHRQQAGFKQRGNAYTPIVKEDISFTRNVEGETYQQQENRTQNQERENDPYQQTRSRQPYDNRKTFSRDDTFSIENTTPTYKDTYEGIQDSSSSSEEKTNIDNYYNQGTQIKNEHSNTFYKNAEPLREEQKIDLPQHESATQINDGRPQKIPRRNFTLSYTDGNRNTPLRNPTQPDRTSGIYINNSPAQTVQTVRNRVKNKQDNPRDRTNQPNKNEGHLDRDDQFKNDNSYETRDGNSFGKTMEREQSSSSDYLSTFEKNKPTKLEPELHQKMGENDGKWIWDGGESVKQKITTPAANVVTVDDRANFMGDKCASGMIRLAGKCVVTD